MRTARLLAFIAALGLAACSSEVLAPQPEQEGYAGSGSQIAPTEATPLQHEGYAGSGS